ncbi:MAG TPA: hypothetical protein VN456_07635 [Desulfosporosinus sp.]|nr:hypothetical protein [Desulfosporosinus sp.]
MEKFADHKEVEIKGRKFIVKKFDARTGSFMLIKVAGIIGPMLKGLDINKIKVESGKTPDLKGIDITSITSGLSGLSEEEFNYIHDKCLQVCFETLPAGPTKVMNNDGTFGVSGLDTNSASTLALVAHALMFNVTGFFSESVFSSIVEGAMNSIQSTVKI